MFKQIIILCSFVLVGDFFLSVICYNTLTPEHGFLASVILGGLWGFYVIRTAINSGALDPRNQE